MGGMVWVTEVAGRKKNRCSLTIGNENNPRDESTTLWSEGAWMREGGESNPIIFL